MCTVTWVFERGGYQLFSNRDERLTRAEARPPVLVDDGAARYLAPTDAEAGGTWISVNEHGLGLTLLNDYQVEGPPEERRISRGVLVRELATASDPSEVDARLREFELARFMGFTLLALHPSGDARALGWNGEALVQREFDSERPLLVSSSHQEVERVRLLRREQLHRLDEVDGDALTAYHRSHEPEPSVYSVCMHREGVETVSATRVAVTADGVSMSYCAGSPCRTPFGEPLALPRTS